jgi:hypothetical protein
MRRAGVRKSNSQGLRPSSRLNSRRGRFERAPRRQWIVNIRCESERYRVFDANGDYIISVMRSDRPKYASDNFAETAEENKATAQGTITYFGMYSVSEADPTIAIHIEGSSFPNCDGADQKRLFVFSGDELS